MEGSKSDRKSKSRRTVPATVPGAVSVEKPSEPSGLSRSSKSRRTVAATVPGAVVVEPSVDEPDDVAGSSRGSPPTAAPRDASAKAKARRSSRANAPGVVAVTEPNGKEISVEPEGVAMTVGVRSSSSGSDAGRKGARNSGTVAPGAVAVAGTTMSSASLRKTAKSGDVAGAIDGVGLQVPASMSSRRRRRNRSKRDASDKSESAAVPGAQIIEGEEDATKSKNDSGKPRVIFEGDESDEAGENVPGAMEVGAKKGEGKGGAEPMILSDNDDLEDGLADRGRQPVISVGLSVANGRRLQSRRPQEEISALNAPVQHFDHYNADLDDHHEKRKSREEGKRKCRICIIVSIVLIGIIVGVSVGVTAEGGSSSSSGDEPSPPPTSPPTMFVDYSVCFQAAASDTSSPRYTSIREILRASSMGNVNLMDNPDSPQRKALCWVADFDELELEAEPSNSPALLQRYALVVFYYTLVDETSSLGLANSNWLSGQHECNWEDLGCTTDDVITDLNLRDQGLAGELPEELADLQSLEVFNVDQNILLTGPLPSSFWSLTSLQSIILARTDITGSLPSPEIGALVNLTRFAAEFFSGPLPDELFSLTKLVSLVNGESFTGTLSTSVGSLTDLEIIQIRISGSPGSIPSEIGELGKLKILELRRSELTGSTLPTELGKLRNLESLALNQCGLTGNIPTELGLLANLKHITLQVNPLTGEIPIEFGDLNKAESIFLRFTDLTGEVPGELCALRDGALWILEADCNSEVVCPLGCCTLCS